MDEPKDFVEKAIEAERAEAEKEKQAAYSRSLERIGKISAALLAFAFFATVGVYNHYAGKSDKEIAEAEVSMAVYQSKIAALQRANCPGMAQDIGLQEFMLDNFQENCSSSIATICGIADRISDPAIAEHCALTQQECGEATEASETQLADDQETFDALCTNS